MLQRPAGVQYLLPTTAPAIFAECHFIPRLERCAAYWPDYPCDNVASAAVAQLRKCP